MKRIGMEFDVDLWFADPAVGLLRQGSRDFWFMCLCNMWKLGQRGELSGTLRDLATLCRCSPAEARAGVDEIKARNVADVNESNGVVTVVNRKMFREHKERVRVRDAVAKSRALRRGDAWPTNDVTNAVSDLKHDPDRGSVTTDPSSPPVSPPDPLSNPHTSPGAAHACASRGLDGMPLVPPPLDTPEFQRAWAEWIAFRRERKPKVTPISATRTLKRMVDWGLDRSIAAIHHSISQGYQGLFEEKQNHGNKPKFRAGSTERNEYGGPDELGVRRLPSQASAD